MRRYMVLVPAFCTFGPLEMVLGYATPYHIVSLIASLITAVGILIIFANVMRLMRELHPNEDTGRALGATAWSLLSVAFLTVLVIGGAGCILRRAFILDD